MFCILKIALTRRLKRVVVLITSFIVVYSGASAFIRWVRRLRRKGSITILAYHDIGEPMTFRSSSFVIARDFARHIRYLLKRYEIASLEEIISMLQSGNLPHRDVVAITFDDGCLGNFENALPLLQKYAIPATVFISTGFIDQTVNPWWMKFDSLMQTIATNENCIPKNNLVAKELWVFFCTSLGRKLLKYLDLDIALFLIELSVKEKKDLNALIDSMSDNLEYYPRRTMMNWEEIKKMQEKGITIGGHTVSHGVLTALSSEQVDKQILGCRARIEEMLGETPRFFAYPVGLTYAFDKNIKARVEKAGFEAACTTIYGKVKGHSDCMLLPRKAVSNQPFFVLKAKLSGLLDFLHL